MCIRDRSYNGKIRESKLLQYLQIQRKWEVNHIVHFVITSFPGPMISTSSDYFPKCCIILIYFSKKRKPKCTFPLSFTWQKTCLCILNQYRRIPQCKINIIGLALNCIYFQCHCQYHVNFGAVIWNLSHHCSKTLLKMSKKTFSLMVTSNFLFVVVVKFRMIWKYIKRKELDYLH